MFADTKAYSGFAVPDLEAARKFYGETLGLRTSVPMEGVLLAAPGGRPRHADLPQARPRAGQLHDPELRSRRRRAGGR